MRLRSREEITFRLKQEAANLWLYATKPQPGAVDPKAPLERLPDPEPIIQWLRGSKFEATVLAVAEQAMRHEIPAMGVVVKAGQKIDWRWDHANKGASPLAYFRRIPYMNPDQVGDYRLIWEFNRHQHLVAMAQAFRFTGDQKLLAEMLRQLESWWTANPFLQGINWTSALEAAFRALSWIWVYHLTGDRMPAEFRSRFLTELYRHGRYLEYNLSVYFSPNTHLQGEAIALHALGVLFPDFPGAARWVELGGRIAVEQMNFQVREDGSHFEQSTYYHVYALDFFLLHSILNDTPDWYREKLERMAEYLAALLGPAGAIPMIGDDDGGRVFHPYGKRDEFGRATLATCAVMFGRGDWPCGDEDLHQQAVWWLGEKALDRPAGQSYALPSRVFAQSGVAVLSCGDMYAVMDNGPFGWASGGHSHCDVLSLTIRAGDEEVLIDPGTFTYVDPVWRNRFRGTAAHNTVRIGGRDQALPAKSFGWLDRPETEVLRHEFSSERDTVVAECRYRGFVHRRHVVLIKPDGVFFLMDEINGPAGEHDLEQFWHPGAETFLESPRLMRIGSRAVLVLGEAGELSSEGEYGWRSVALGEKRPAPLVRVFKKSVLPAYFAAVVDCSGEIGGLAVEYREGRLVCLYREWAVNADLRAGGK